MPPFYPHQPNSLVAGEDRDPSDPVVILDGFPEWNPVEDAFEPQNGIPTGTRPVATISLIFLNFAVFLVLPLDNKDMHDGIILYETRCFDPPLPDESLAP